MKYCKHTGTILDGAISFLWRYSCDNYGDFIETECYEFSCNGKDLKLTIEEEDALSKLVYEQEMK